MLAVGKGRMAVKNEDDGGSGSSLQGGGFWEWVIWEKNRGVWEKKKKEVWEKNGGVWVKSWGVRQGPARRAGAAR